MADSVKSLLFETPAARPCGFSIRSGAFGLPFLIFVFILGQIAPGRCEGREVISLTGDPWPPFVVGELGEEAESGIAIELVREIFAQLPEFEVSFPMIPWNRALREVELGTKDGIVVLLKTPERERYMDYTDPLFTARNFLWYSTVSFPSGFGWLTLADLDAYTIGMIRGYSYGQQIDLAIASGTLRATPVPSVEQLFTMLAGDRIDLALANDAVGYALAKRHVETAQIVPAEKATGIDVYHLAFSRKTRARRLIPDINPIISRLRDNGYIDRLISGEGGAGAP